MTAAKALVVCLDGVRYDSLLATPTPALTRLAEDGFLAPTRIFGPDVAPTMSGPAIASIATGVWPDRHRIVANELHGHALDIHPDFLTRLQRADPARRTFAALDWAPLGHAVDGGPMFSDAITAKLTLATPPTWSANAGDDARLIAASEQALAETDIDAAFVYLAAPDFAAHEHGCLGPEYRDAIETCDRQLATLLSAVRGRRRYESERWLVIVVTDHGHLDEGGHGGGSDVERTAWLAAAGHSIGPVAPATLSNVDVAPTVLAHLGVPWHGEPSDGHPLVSAPAMQEAVT